jgi:SAM-dependent methyltransferase
VDKSSRDNRDGAYGYAQREPPLTSRYYIPLRNLSTLLKRIISHLPNQEGNKIILDLGCGEKPYQPFFAGQYSAYVGVDISSKTLCDIKSSGDHLPIRDSTFDLCICSLTYEHVVDPRQMTREVHRVLKDAGVFIMSTHAVAAIHDYPSDYWRWTDQGLKLLLGEYFSNIVVHEVTTPLETISHLIVNYFPMNKGGSLFTVLVNKMASSIGKNRVNRNLPRLVGLYLVTSVKTKK